MNVQIGPPAPDALAALPAPPPLLRPPVGALLGLLGALAWVSWAAPHALQAWLWPVFLSAALAGEMLWRAWPSAPVRRLRRLARLLPCPGVLRAGLDGVVFCPDASMPAHRRLATLRALDAALTARPPWLQETSLRVCARRGAWGVVGGVAAAWSGWRPAGDV